MTPIYLFVLSPPYSGSTVLWRLLEGSAHTSALPNEGQWLEPVTAIMRADPWNPDRELPWDRIKAAWHGYWAADKPVLLEKSPPNIIRARQLQAHFQPASFIVSIRDPYATIEGLYRRRGLPPMVGYDTIAAPEVYRRIAELWVRMARTQLDNLATLERATFVRYEDFAQDPAKVARDLSAFVPALGDLDPHRKFLSHAYGAKPKARAMRNFNQDQIDRLPYAAIVEINRVLEAHGDLMDRLGYDYYRPAPLAHRWHHHRAWAREQADRFSRRVRRKLGFKAKAA